MDNILNFLKGHSGDLMALLAAPLGAVLALGIMPRVTPWQAFQILCAGIAVNAYLAPLAFHFMGLPTSGPFINAVGFIAGLLGMKVIVKLNKWADTVENPADFFRPFKDDKK